MPKFATKAASNVFYKARMVAASFNDRLASRDGAAELTGIDRNRISHIELSTITPYPEEVLILADTYNSPELLNYYCSTLCPIGRETVDSLPVVSLEQAGLKLLSSTRHIAQLREEIIDILEDGMIDESEAPRLKEILRQLKQADKDINTLVMVCKKALGDRRETK